MNRDAKRKRKKGPSERRDPAARARAEQQGAGGSGAHHTRERDVSKGHSRKPKHKKDLRREASFKVANSWLEACDEPQPSLFNFISREDTDV